MRWIVVAPELSLESWSVIDSPVLSPVPSLSPDQTAWIGGLIVSSTLSTLSSMAAKLYKKENNFGLKEI